MARGDTIASRAHAFVQALGRHLGGGLRIAGRAGRDLVVGGLRIAVRAGRNMLIGGALGLFVGILIALAAQSSPIVASVTASTMALVTAYGALRVVPAVTAADENAAATRATADPNPAWIIIGFGFFAVTGVLTGIYLRTHQILSPSPQAEVQRWESAGFSRNQALCLTAASFGYAFAGRETAGLEGAPVSPSAFQACVTLSLPPEVAAKSMSVLLNDVADACQTLDGMKFLTLRDAEGTLKSYGPPWSEIYDKVAGSDKSDADKLDSIREDVHQRCIDIWKGK